jgi:hypothetical protein
MGTFRLHRFSHINSLKAIQPKYLLALLEPHKPYFADRGVHLDAADGDTIDYEGLRDVLMNPDSTVPVQLVDDLFYMHELSDDHGMDSLLTAVRAMPADERIELDLPEGPTPTDVAVQVRLKAPHLLERHYAQHFLRKKRSFEYYQPREGADLTFRMPSREQVEALEKDLDDRLEVLKRARCSKVFIYQKEDGVWFLVRHGQPCKREATVMEDGSGTVYYRPEVYDVLRYDPRSGDLSINSETKRIGELYREKLGLHLFGDAEFFPGTAKYTLDPLLRDGEDCLACSDVVGMERVKLREVQFVWGGPLNETEVRKADDLFALYRRRGQSLPRGHLTRAVFSVKFKDSNKPRSVSIRPSNVATFVRDDDAVLVEEWLIKRGFVTNPSVNSMTRETYAVPARAVANH